MRRDFFTAQASNNAVMRIVLGISAIALLVAGVAADTQSGKARPGHELQVAGKGGFRPVPGETVLEISVANRGEVYIDLETQLAPKATAHIIALTRQGFYNGLSFFKVITSPRPYLVQTGDAQSRTLNTDDERLGSGGSELGKVVYEDTHIPCTSGSVVLATANGDRDSGDSQFYILLADYSRLLQGTGTVFGRVVVGMDTVTRIQLGDRITQAQILTG